MEAESPCDPVAPLESSKLQTWLASRRYVTFTLEGSMRLTTAWSWNSAS